MTPVDRVRDLTPYGAVVLGSAIYVGQWGKEAAAFLTANEQALSQRAMWFFSSGPTGKGDPVQLMNGFRFPAGLQPIADRIHPRDTAFFHGVIDMKKVSLPEKLILKGIKAPLGDFRDWAAISSWAEGIAGELKKVISDCAFGEAAASPYPPPPGIVRSDLGGSPANWHGDIPVTHPNRLEQGEADPQVHPPLLRSPLSFGPRLAGREAGWILAPPALIQEREAVRIRYNAPVGRFEGLAHSWTSCGYAIDGIRTRLAQGSRVVRETGSTARPKPGGRSSSARRPSFRPSPAATLTLFQKACAAIPEVQVRKMFGYPCGFVNRYMTVGVYEDRIFVRLPPESQSTALPLAGAHYLEPMPGRPMRDYVVLAPRICSTPKVLIAWFRQAVDGARQLPPKKSGASGHKR